MLFRYKDVLFIMAWRLIYSNFRFKLKKVQKQTAESFILLEGGREGRKALSREYPRRFFFLEKDPPHLLLHRAILSLPNDLRFPNSF